MTETLVYYDGPQVVVKHAAKGNFLSVAVNDDTYIVVYISHKALHNLKKGIRDLRSVMKKASHWMLSDNPYTVINPDTVFKCTLFDENKIEEQYLPKAGFYLINSKMKPIEYLLIGIPIAFSIGIGLCTESFGGGFIALAAAATISLCYARSAEII